MILATAAGDAAQGLLSVLSRHHEYWDLSDQLAGLPTQFAHLEERRYGQMPEPGPPPPYCPARQ
ncbi:hypothetical protein LBMAG15_06510 [Actinomycetes bacterium]|nr:hypothetical protein LBMAG15_06510 [Actinomycetes bacterium]